MLLLEQSLQAWGASGFESAFKQEIARLDIDQLPLQQGLSSGSHVVSGPTSVLVNEVAEFEDSIRIRAGLFFQSVIAGCACADDPTPVNEIEEYCEAYFDIDKTTAQTSVTLVSDR